MESKYLYELEVTRNGHEDELGWFPSSFTYRKKITSRKEIRELLKIAKESNDKIKGRSIYRIVRFDNGKIFISKKVIK
jgi:hypothetical protein